MIEWVGNLKDDCRAEWEGLYLHAEEMDRNNWWWAVSDEKHEQIASSNDGEEIYRNGKSARFAAENAAREHINI